MVSEVELVARTITVVTAEGDEVEIIAFTPEEARNFFAFSDVFKALLGFGRVGKWLAGAMILIGSTIVAFKQAMSFGGQ